MVVVARPLLPLLLLNFKHVDMMNTWHAQQSEVRERVSGSEREKVENGTGGSDGTNSKRVLCLCVHVYEC